MEILMGLCGEKTKPIQSQSPAFGRKSEVRISTTPVLFRMTVARCCPGNPKQIEWVAKVAGADTIPISTNFKGCDMTFMNKNVAGTMLLVAMFLLICVFSSSAEGALKGGTAKVDITPPIGAWLSGYGSRN